jgi:hypothetical protein
MLDDSSENKATRDSRAEARYGLSLKSQYWRAVLIFIGVDASIMRLLLGTLVSCCFVAPDAQAHDCLLSHIFNTKTCNS